MIHVQIASDVTADGVRGVRWVLLEAAESQRLEAEAAAVPGVTAPATAPTAAPTAAQKAAPAAIDPLPAAASGDSVADSLRLRALKALVVALGLGAALWTAAVQIGPPGRAAPAAATRPAVNPPAHGVTPQAMPTPPADGTPAAPAPLPSRPALPAVPQSATDTPAAPASAGLPRLTASL